MTLRDLLFEADDEAVIAAGVRLYEQSEVEWLPEAIREVLQELRRLTPDSAGAAYELHIERIVPEAPPEQPFWEVSFRKEGDFERYGLDMSPWPQWLATRVPSALCQTIPAAEIVAHCVWEMTFYGFTQEAAAENRAELDRRLRDLDEGKVQGIPWEEVKERLREELESLKSDSSDALNLPGRARDEPE